MNLAKLLLGVPRKPPVPADPDIGSAFGGGFYYGKIKINGLLYWLVVSSKTYESTKAVVQSGNATDPASSTFDGLANASLYGALPYQAMQYCLSLTDASGNSDYYLGSYYETEILYRNLKPTTTQNNNGSGTNNFAEPPTTSYTATVPSQTSVVAFKTGGAQALEDSTYWTSTWQANSQNAFAILFSTGALTLPTKSTNWYVRPIRRILIPGQ